MTPGDDEMEMDELDEEGDDDVDDGRVYHGQISTIYDTDKVRRGPKIVDKTQTKLGVW